MPNDTNAIVDNLKRVDAWLRLLLVVVYAALLYLVAAPVVAVLIVAQALFALITGGPNENLQRFGAMLGEYIHQVVRFLTYNTDAKPFPFSAFPGGEDAAAADRVHPDAVREEDDIGAPETPAAAPADEIAPDEGATDGNAPGAADSGRPFRDG